jgi:riboflavin kinase/FMN adenylyltransferase
MPGPERVVVLGSFDGVHLGHQQLVSHAVQLAEEQGLYSTAITFDPLPEAVLAPRTCPPTLMDIDERVAALRELNPDELFVVKPSPELLGLPAEVFAEGLLRKRFRAVAVVGGEGFRFGKGRGGDASLLRRLGFRVEEVPPLEVERAPISSTRIRALVTGGDVEAAGRLLSRPYTLTGVVAHGREVGRTLGFPTANLRPNPGRQIPARGVYACEALIAGGPGAGEPCPAWRQRNSVVNIGVRPTFQGEGEYLSVEAHLLDFSEDLYGARLRLVFRHHLRDERRFANVELLKEQIERDRRSAEALLD